MNMMGKKKIYTPLQVASGSFLGGPIAAFTMLKLNFDKLNKPDCSRNTLLVGVFITVGMLAIAPFLPEEFPNSLIPLLLAAISKFIADKWQVSKDEITRSEIYEFHSNWLVVGTSILYAILFLVIAALIIYAQE